MKNRKGAVTALLGIKALAVILAMAAGVLAQSPEPDIPIEDAGPGAGGDPRSTTMPSLEEAHGDWLVRCFGEGDERRCDIAQQQHQRETNKMVLAVELEAGADGILAGAMIVPFGLRLPDGVVMQVDERPASRPIPFATCLPVGCLVPLRFTAKGVEVLRAGQALKLNAITHEGGNQVGLTISLRGISAALNRLGELGR